MYTDANIYIYTHYLKTELWMVKYLHFIDCSGATSTRHPSCPKTKHLASNPVFSIRIVLNVEHQIQSDLHMNHTFKHSNTLNIVSFLLSHFQHFFHQVIDPPIENHALIEKQTNRPTNTNLYLRFFGCFFFVSGETVVSRVSPSHFNPKPDNIQQFKDIFLFNKRLLSSNLFRFLSWSNKRRGQLLEIQVVTHLLCICLQTSNPFYIYRFRVWCFPSSPFDCHKVE